MRIPRGRQPGATCSHDRTPSGIGLGLVDSTWRTVDGPRHSNTPVSLGRWGSSTCARCDEVCDRAGCRYLHFLEGGLEHHSETVNVVFAVVESDVKVRQV